jgi:hypothetical protein
MLLVYFVQGKSRNRSLRPIDSNSLYKIAHSAARRIVAGRGAAVRMAMSGIAKESRTRHHFRKGSLATLVPHDLARVIHDADAGT